MTSPNNHDISFNMYEPDSIENGYVDDRKRTNSIRSYSSIGSEHELGGYDEEEVKKETEAIQSGKCILIKPAHRKREMTICDHLLRTPTPTKYYMLLQENENMVRSMKK